MDGATNPKFLEKRLFFRLGLIIHDNSKLMVVLGLISCLFMSSLIFIGADWAEGFGEDDVESVNAGRLISERFSTDENESGRNFRYIVYHPTYNDSDLSWQTEVINALEAFENHPNVNITYSWQVDEIHREKFVVQDETGFYAINDVFIKEGQPVLLLKHFIRS